MEVLGTRRDLPAEMNHFHRASLEWVAGGALERRQVHG